MPPVRYTSDTVEEIRLPAGGSFIITDEVGTELFRVTATGDAVKVGGTTVTPALQAVLNAVTSSAAELNILDGVTATAAELNDADVSAVNVARTATADGLTTGTITATGRRTYVTVTSADANHIVVLPAPVIGLEVILNVGATGFELRSSDPATIAINGGTGADAESAIPADTTVLAVCVSATAWKAIKLDADSDVAKVEAAA